MSSTKRKKITPNFDARLLVEANNRCPLCGDRLLGEKAGRSIKLYDLAHIYPHSPTQEQKETLKDVEKPDNIESFENLIALCKDCHRKYDFHTTKEEYMRLYNLKQEIMKQNMAIDAATSVQITEEIKEVLFKLKEVDITKILQLSYTPIAVEQKIKDNLLREKVKNFVVHYFPFVQSLFEELDNCGKNKFHQIAGEFKSCFLKMDEQDLSTENLFYGIVDWLKSKTQSQNRDACEIVVAFFVQNCEVFNEISK
jgi:hypothetical protein